MTIELPLSFTVTMALLFLSLACIDFKFGLYCF
jgi:hypothetical protein